MANKSSKKDTKLPGWPWLLRIRPRQVIALVGALLLLAWGVFLAVDIWGWIGEELNRPAWRLLFNDRPVEWLAWLVLALAATASGFLGGRLYGGEYDGAGKFFLWLSVGLALMLVEDAGDIRHVISSEVERLYGSEVLGLPYRVVSDAPYFTALAAVPVYAVVRYGRHIWQATSARRYLIGGVSLYAIAAIGSAVRHLNDLYIRVGAQVDAWLFGGRFPIPEGMDQERAHFFVIDSVVEESVELLAVTLLLATVLSFALFVRNRTHQ